jgi:hypothetical protein
MREYNMNKRKDLLKSIASDIDAASGKLDGQIRSEIEILNQDIVSNHSLARLYEPLAEILYGLLRENNDVNATSLLIALDNHKYLNDLSKYEFRQIADNIARLKDLLEQKRQVSINQPTPMEEFNF